MTGNHAWWPAVQLDAKPSVRLWHENPDKSGFCHGWHLMTETARNTSPAGSNYRHFRWCSYTLHPGFPGLSAGLIPGRPEWHFNKKTELFSVFKRVAAYPYLPLEIRCSIQLSYGGKYFSRKNLRQLY
jgi:hypothetical protein